MALHSCSEVSALAAEEPITLSFCSVGCSEKSAQCLKMAECMGLLSVFFIVHITDVSDYST